MNLRTISLAVLASTALTGCEALKMLEKKEPPPCPPVYVLADAGKITKFRDGPGRDLTDVEVEAEITSFTGACEYDEDGAILDIQVTMGVTRGPADTDRKADLSYFVAIPLYYPAPEAKAVFPVTVTFPEGSNYVKYNDEPLTMRVPVKDGDVIQKYEIYLGFQATPEELERNRKAR